MASKTMKQLTVKEKYYSRREKLGWDITHKGFWTTTVSVYPKIDFDRGKFIGYEISWASIGAVGVKETKEFIKALQKAVELVEKDKK